MLIVITVLVISLILLIVSIYKDKINFLSVKLANVEEKINSTLLKRKELLKDSEDVIKEITKTKKEVYINFDELNDKEISMMELDRKLLVYMNEFYLIKDKYEELQKSDDFKKIAFMLAETEDLLSAYKDYYNDNASKYNKVIKCFPVCIISLLKGRKEKLFFDSKIVLIAIIMILNIKKRLPINLFFVMCF